MRKANGHILRRQMVLQPTSRVPNKSAAQRFMMNQEGCESAFKPRMLDVGRHFQQHRLVKLFDRPLLLEEPALNRRQRRRTGGSSIYLDCGFRLIGDV